MEEKVGIVVQKEDKTETGVQGKNKDVCVTCLHHTLRGHGEWWGVHEGGGRGKLSSGSLRHFAVTVLTSVPPLKIFLFQFVGIQTFDWSTLVQSGTQYPMGKVQFLCRKGDPDDCVKHDSGVPDSAAADSC
ncbi:hypothetical protein CRENBAI_001979 [Crenichthys baileyi]|uniref:Uncharacterized protein n=1 Tax=Crenichthys baileyi TaxID=28760 RepID=A0AAV9R219_9TELE